jgi:ribosomal protein S18 acetylase RimI-like enzyme
MTALRAATIDDVDALGALHVRAWQAAYAGMMPADFLAGLRSEDRAAMWRGWFADPGTAALSVGVLDERVCGFVCFGPHASDDDEVEVYALNVDPDAWGRGVGTALLEHAVAVLESQHEGDAVLWVVAENERARRLYEAAGWAWDGGSSTDDVGGMPVTELRYRLPLSTRRPGG